MKRRNGGAKGEPKYEPPPHQELATGHESYYEPPKDGWNGPAEMGTANGVQHPAELPYQNQIASPHQQPSELA